VTLNDISWNISQFIVEKNKKKTLDILFRVFFAENIVKFDQQ
jgi:hypothetical protein